MHAPASLPPVHIALIQPFGQVHALGLLDAARYLRHQLRRFGGTVTLGKNRLREDALNIVFGAHLGFAAEWTERHACLFFNLEQLGEGGAAVDAAYLELLRKHPVADYDAANLAAYASDAADVPVLPLLHAPYLPQTDLPLEERPIDLLFVGTMNERRRAFLERIEACGLTVACFDQPVYGEERDAFIRQAKAVLNCHYYPSSRFEQARVSHCLSLGTPVIAERTAATTTPHPAFDDAVVWLEEGAGFERFWRERFNTAAFFDDARARLAAWRTHDPVDAYADLMAFAAGVFQAHAQQRSAEPWRPAYVNLGSGKDYKPGWLNIDILDRAEPDLVLDLAQPIEWPVNADTRFGGTLELHAGSVQAIYANNVLEHVPDLPALMGNALALLADGGLFEIEVPYEKSSAAWQDPTHVRALNEKSWRYYTDWFWYLGWFEHRFEIAAQGWMDGSLRDCAQQQADFMRVTLRKVATTPHERTLARTMRPDFGGLPEDDDASAADAPALASPPDPGTLLVVDEARPAVATAPAAPIDAAALPDARRVLEVGPAERSLEAAWRAARADRGDAQWQRVDDCAALSTARGTADLLLLCAPIESHADPMALLAALRQHAAPGAPLWLAADNQASWNELEALLEGDLDAASTKSKPRFSVATLTRALLDAGWLPQLAAQQAIERVPGPGFDTAAATLALAHQVPPATLQRVLSVGRFAMQAVPADALPTGTDTGPARFSVVVPTTRDGQFRRNVQASPGLAEVAAPIVAFRGAAHPAEALEQSLAHCPTDWVLFAHQDVYFPQGFGQRLNAILAAVPAEERTRTLIGFAGVGVDRASGRTAAAGLVIDRSSRFDHPASDSAVSIDELAIVVSRDSVHRIDPALGWHLWATDLCLTAMDKHRCFARIVRVPLFHHSSNDYALSDAFRHSAEVLAAKHEGFGPIVTLCGTIETQAAAAA